MVFKGNILKGKIVFHILFWLLSFYFLIHYFSILETISRIDYLFTALFHLSLLFAVYLNVYYLIPTFLRNFRDVWKYTIALVLLFLVFYGLYIVTFDYLADRIFPNYYLITDYGYRDMLNFFVAYLGLTSLLFYGSTIVDHVKSNRKIIQDWLIYSKQNVLHFYRNRAFLHLLFWAISFYFLLQHFSISQQVTTVDYLFTALFHLSILIAVYTNLYFLIPRFLNKRDYWKYVVAIVILFLIFYSIHVFTYDYLADILFPNYYLIVFYDYFELFKYFVAYIGITSLFVLSKSWIDLADSRKKLAEKEKELIHNELKALKAQVNPHFLFNSLNSIYSLALNKSDHTPEVILKLSNVLRYMIYESNEQLVALQKEIDFIRNYIDLQKLRTQNPESVKLQINGTIKEQKIAPLILIVFIENAFKHGVKGDTINQFINIHINVSNSEIQFVSENNAGLVDETEGHAYKGLGLENVKRRLELLYHENHELTISKSDGTFSIELKIKL